MIHVTAIIDRAKDGTYNIYCEDYPTIFGMGGTIDEAKRELQESILQTRELGPNALNRPNWIEKRYEITYRFDVKGMLEYYSGIITPVALSRLSGINQKQIWSYLHGRTKPRKAQIDKIEESLHRLGHELIHTSF